jgi:sensor domain CHASE-containing protein
MFGDVMKRIAAFILLIAVSVACSLPATAQNQRTRNNARLAKRAAKQNQKAIKKAARKQRKAMKKYQKQQRRAAKQQQRRGR